MATDRAEPLPYNVIDLDQATGGPIDIKFGGGVYRIYSAFSANNVRHYQRLLDRERREFMRQASAQLAFDEWRAQDEQARQAGLPPPKPFDATPFANTSPDFYAEDEYERDVTNLLASVWQASEWSLPESERVDVEATIGRLTLEQSRALLLRLWPLRNAPRNPPPPPAPPDQAAAETPVVEPTPIRKPRKRKGAAGAE